MGSARIVFLKLKEDFLIRWIYNRSRQLNFNQVNYQKEWTAKQLKKGMEFVIHDDWFPLCSTIIKKYRGAGWIVKLNVEVEPGRRQYVLNIRHPQESTD